MVFRAKQKSAKKGAGKPARSRGKGLRKTKHRDGTELVIITGMSGSGKASALKAFEDLGYYCVDNLPVELIPRFAELALQSGEIPRTALVVDVREGAQLEKLPAILKSVKRTDSDARHLSRSDRPGPAAPFQRDAPAASAGNPHDGARFPDDRAAPSAHDSLPSPTSSSTPRSSTSTNCGPT